MEKIAFIEYSLKEGGAERVCSLLCNHWSAKYEIELILISKKPIISYKTNDKIRIVHLCDRKNKRVTKLEKLRLLKREIKKFDPDVCVSFLDGPNIYSSIVCRQLKIPCIISERNFANGDGLYRKLINFAKITIYNKSNVLVVQTEKIKTWFIQHGFKKDLIIIPNPIEATNLRWNPINKKIISGGRLVKQKNYIEGITAFSRLLETHPDFEYHIYGNGPEKQHILKFINQKRLNNKVFLHPYTGSFLKELSESEALFLPSSFEGMPNVLLEACSIGVPSISTNQSSGFAIELSKQTSLCRICTFEVSDMANKIKEQISFHDENVSISKVESEKVKLIFSNEVIFAEWDKIISSQMKDGKK